MDESHVTCWSHISDRMSDKLEDRQGDMLSHITMETQGIKVLEQQLTDGEEERAPPLVRRRQLSTWSHTKLEPALFVLLLLLHLLLLFFSYSCRPGGS